ncbi:MAG TPA: hypothetical protein VFM37_01545 [Pseudonocardiaceae bacterium]|nr:hypothetical protein [Pseudonocardiaceae bacterium]
MSWPDQGEQARVGRLPSGLFPSRPPRPSYREPHQVRAGAVAAGLSTGALWMLLFGLLATSVRSYGWWTLAAGAAAWVMALVLVRYGDRGVAVGVAVAVGIGWVVAGAVLVAAWAARADWPLW